MGHSTIQLLIFVLLSISALQTWATGFVNLPATGFQTNKGTSAYTLCNTTDELGVGFAVKPTLIDNNKCAIFPVNEIAPPSSGFSLVHIGSHPVAMNNGLTGGTGKKIGIVNEFLWRNAEKTECVYGTKVVTTLGDDADYDVVKPGKQYFKVNDVSRGGFGGVEVEVAYAAISVTAKPLYRAGRTFSAVQYRGGRSAPILGYLEQLPITLAHDRTVNGINDESLQIQSQEQQSASPDENWVTFTTYVSIVDSKGKASAASSMLYIKSACPDEPFRAVADAIRLRQTFPPFIELSVPGLVPSGGKILPGTLWNP